ncbi:saccharopine dehydrogenase [Mycobacterium sp. CBMA293]|uniref:saccharopine dehydrogenase family protein n=1 Tax=unclassified Mycolicibacterium TaxID=2636767 RepID=UPI0012DE71F5|nr:MULTISPECIES: saccharopine dehydrogenase NADP-binding domain-containing protein [unclassified Mycolicibacterium]MUL49862.1 saccharopine dehydrogenase [Mycolicibacterium sp. CBMA 360]MUL61504.1 saccharopine dehydrogenase [Mycolicibacterium sp. CBMA 335]MUL74239.1 saccharopine dehydrogenase [Mycolicibacterium sp. CBMA 311]MUL97135.1 saccharopine dehydrogenase [Mycolicibacterium sp. CBMA 230]MUM08198.1 saccharopine dehydrogenase [Mycolicibacterium sp. CBMA 213]
MVDNRRRVVFIGAAGEMCRLAIERFAVAAGDWKLELYDIRPELLDQLIELLPTGLATAARLDLYDADGLRNVVEGAALVVLGAGPYNRTAGPVMDACLAAKVPYLDFDDDIESTLHALTLTDNAREAGVPMYIGCGASPGITNVLVADAAGELDSVENIDVYWVVGDERGSIGRAVLDHMLRVAAGPCMTWQNGGPVMHQSWLETRWTELGAGLGLTMVHETAHPEPVTLPRKYPDAKNIRCFGGLDPAPYNGLIRGVGLAVQKGQMPVEEAIDFLVALLTNKFGSVQGWRHALSGLRDVVRTGEVTRTELIKFLAKAAVGHAFPYKSGLKVEVTGLRNGVPTVVSRRTPTSGPGTYLFTDMAAATGTACAAFMVVALDDESGSRAGVFTPEEWAEPQRFYQALERVGTPRDEILDVSR